MFAKRHSVFLSLLLFGYALGINAAVLPEERSDLLYHSYDGGEVEVNGPSVLVRKHTTTNTSVFYNYYVDHITSASLDVQISGSAYEEERTEQSVGIDYLRGKTTMSLSYTNSSENDYNADTFSLSVSQDFFGDLSTLTMGYSMGEDLVSQRTSNNPFTITDRAEITRQSYRLGFSQVLSTNALAGLGFEVITDEADSLPGSTVTLNNPYRQYRFYTNPADPSAGYTLRDELYPRTRTSYALSLRGSYYLAYRAALHGEIKYFEDDWGIVGNTFALGYSHPINDWTLDFRYRLYSQTKADFYADIFNEENEFNFMARDKELSTFTSNSLGITVTYDFIKNGWSWIDKGSINASLEHIVFDYEDYRDATAGGPAGSEPLYSFSADVLQLFVSIWY
jgi:hypothetical protein